MSRDEARAASYHADTADAERKAMYDVAEKLAAALRFYGDSGNWPRSWAGNPRPPFAINDRGERARAALEAWKPYRPIWEITG